MYLSKVLGKMTSFNSYVGLIVLCTILVVFYNFNNTFDLYTSEIKYPLEKAKDINDLHTKIVEAYLSRRQVSTNSLLTLGTEKV